MIQTHDKMRTKPKRRGAISVENNDTVTERQLGSENNSAQANRPTYRFDRPAIEHRLLPTSSWGAYFRAHAIVAQIVRYMPVSWIMAFVDTGSLEIRNRRYAK